MALLAADGSARSQRYRSRRSKPCRATPGRCSCASTRSLETTATFKPKRRDDGRRRLRPRPGRRDPLYVYDADAQAYVALDAARFAAIESGAMRF